MASALHTQDDQTFTFAAECKMRATMLIGMSLVAVLGPAAAWSGEALNGRATVIDGDTLNVRGKVIGLFGIAAPRLKQACLNGSGQGYPCGTISAQALAAHLGVATIACETKEPDQHGRILAICRKGGEDLGAWMSRHGHAVADRRISAAYVPDETMAWAKRWGIWAGVFDDPMSRQRTPYPAANHLVIAQPDGSSTTSSVRR
ncbi:thermonuclease family protein [Methylorubrum rhodesianum]|uniref:Thermonuclease family protein n=1 Tax=Methylorubrum rhodesianum TaxID=29427 RepID=A0ABU9ZGR8_9HYPH|nr:thermonuclease family protein [Methylorubrum rhodesianum]